MVQGIESIATISSKIPFDEYHIPSAPIAADNLQSPESEGFLQALSSARALNGELQSLGLEALLASNNGLALTPKEMLNLSVKAHEFVFQAQITATVASKTADGISQLFRQQG